MDTRLFYVYEHWRPDKEECFYVGKGRGIRANNMSRRNAHHKAIQAKLASIGMVVEVRLVASGVSQDEAFEIEVKRIKFWKEFGIKLANKSNGGDGNTGYVHTDAAKLKMSLTAKEKGFKPPVLTGDKNPFYGKKHSESAKKAMSEAAKNRKWSLEEKIKHSERLKIALAKKRELAQ
jgi:hypothetical protein